MFLNAVPAINTALFQLYLIIWVVNILDVCSPRITREIPWVVLSLRWIIHKQRFIFCSGFPCLQSSQAFDKYMNVVLADCEEFRKIKWPWHVVQSLLFVVCMIGYANFWQLSWIALVSRPFSITSSQFLFGSLNIYRVKARFFCWGSSDHSKPNMQPSRSWLLSRHNTCWPWSPDSEGGHLFELQSRAVLKHRKADWRFLGLMWYDLTFQDTCFSELFLAWFY